MSEYGHTEATQISNQLGQQSLDMNEGNLNTWKLNTLLHHQQTNADKGKSTQDTRDDVTEDVVKVPVVAKTLKTTAKATPRSTRGHAHITLDLSKSSTVARGHRRR